LGQNIFGVPVNTDPTIFPNFLESLTDNYSILSPENSLYIGNLPCINDIILSSVNNINNQYYIVFKYINYDIFQSLTLLNTGLTIAESFNEHLLKVLSSLYGKNSTMSVLNFNSNTESIYSGEENTMTVIISAKNLIKPCIVRGTNVVAIKMGCPYLTTIEKLKVGDYVVNQDTQPVKIIHHTKDIIVTDDWTAPYVIPSSYFGKDQPYTKLLISGDHGIRMTKRDNSIYRLYPYTIKQGLKQLPAGITVEYHHIKLENQDDFFIANGLLVEGLRNTLRKE